MKLCMYVMAPEPISTVYFIYPSRQSVCLYVYAPVVARQRLNKVHPPFIASQRLGKRVPVATNTRKN
jgi:hypothetical protein